MLCGGGKRERERWSERERERETGQEEDKEWEGTLRGECKDEDGRREKKEDVGIVPVRIVSFLRPILGIYFIYLIFNISCFNKKIEYDTTTLKQ